MSKPITQMTCVELKVVIDYLNDLISWARSMAKSGDPAGEWAKILDRLTNDLDIVEREYKRC